MKNDTIYRADAIKAVRKIVPVETEIDSTLLDKAEVIVELSALPSADAVHIETYRELYEKYVELKHASAEAVHKPDYSYEADMVKRLRQAEAVQGEWIEREDWNGDSYYDCSVCGESFVLFDGTPSMNLYHFCPNCGARMTPYKGGDDECV